LILSAVLSQDLFFEIVRRKTHIFCDAAESANVLELKRIIEGILKIPVSKQELLKRSEDDAWQTLDDLQLLSHYGFTQQNTKAQSPAVIALCVRDGLSIVAEDDGVIIDELSSPPPIPDAMRQEQNPQNEQ
uniref:Ubiquitin-like domain-containing protein n=1 Tax=Dracunculus medinensis TaxID=318479 RepID=A0A0N4U2F3_DRAME